MAEATQIMPFPTECPDVPPLGYQNFGFPEFHGISFMCVCALDAKRTKKETDWKRRPHNRPQFQQSRPKSQLRAAEMLELRSSAEFSLCVNDAITPKRRTRTGCPANVTVSSKVAQGPHIGPPKCWSSDVTTFRGIFFICVRGAKKTQKSRQTVREDPANAGTSEELDRGRYFGSASEEHRPRSRTLGH